VLTWPSNSSDVGCEAGPSEEFDGQVSTLPWSSGATAQRSSGAPAPIGDGVADGCSPAGIGGDPLLDEADDGRRVATRDEALRGGR